MKPIVFKYPLDTTGRNPNNLVNGEEHDIGVILPGRRSRIFVPTYGPFYTEGMVIRVRSTGQVLQPRIHYIATEFYQAAAKRTGMEVCTAIVITDSLVPSDLVISYQVVGGEFQLSTSVLQNAIDRLEIDKRPVKWGDIIGLPEAFPPSDHLHDIGDVYGFEYLIPPLEGIEQAILTGSTAMQDFIMQWVNVRVDEMNLRVDATRELTNEHIDDRDNPHDVTKSQVGLGEVENYKVAPQAEAVGGTAASFYMTPLSTRQAIDNRLDFMLKAHTDRFDNPHRVTKSQVGLGLVDNYSTSTQGEAQQGTLNNRFMTPLRTSEAIAFQVGNAFTAHAGNRNNPHGVTKAQVGLGLVQNFPMATEQEALQGTADDRYMSPLTVRYIVEQISGDLAGGHITNYDNPHRVTKAQVGLGNVDNYATANQQQAEDGALNTLFMTPLRTKQAIAANVGDIMSAHTGDYSNPHRVTKAQVGLGNVDNYGTATQQEAVQGTLNNKFMTPLRVKDAIDSFKLNVFDPHANSKENPHQVNKEQVGLGSVLNYGVATVGEAQAAANADGPAVNNKYITPSRMRDAFDLFKSEFFFRHTDNLDNPHQVTKGQVGLSNVLNYGVATQQEALQGTRNDVYMTALRVREVVNSVGGGQIEAHINDHDNPHQVTAEQIGAISKDMLDAGLATVVPKTDLMGAVGDSFFVKEDGVPGSIDADRVMSRLAIVTSDAERTDMMNAGEDWQDIYNSWYRMSILGNKSIDAVPVDQRGFAYNEDTGILSSTRTSTSLTGFISQNDYTDYVFEAVLNSTDADKGLIGLCLGYYADENGARTLTLTRTPGGALGYSAGLGTRNVPTGDATTPMALFGVQYNATQTGVGSESKLVASSNAVKWGDGTVNAARRQLNGDLAGNTGWKYQNGGVRVRATRVGNIITVETSDFVLDATGEAAQADRSTAPFVAAAKLTIDLADVNKPYLADFQGPQRIGFACLGQNATTWKTLDRPGARGTIVDPRDNTVRQYVNGQWTILPTTTPEGNVANWIKPGRLYNNYRTGRLFEGLRDGTYQEVTVAATSQMDELIEELTLAYESAAALIAA